MKTTFYSIYLTTNNSGKHWSSLFDTIATNQYQSRANFYSRGVCSFFIYNYKIFSGLVGSCRTYGRWALLLFSLLPYNVNEYDQQHGNVLDREWQIDHVHKRTLKTHSQPCAIPIQETTVTNRYSSLTEQKRTKEKTLQLLSQSLLPHFYTLQDA